MSTNTVTPCPLARFQRPDPANLANPARCHAPSGGVSDRAARRAAMDRPMRSARQDSILASRWMAENA